MVHILGEKGSIPELVIDEERYLNVPLMVLPYKLRHSLVMVRISTKDPGFKMVALGGLELFTTMINCQR